MQMRETKEIRSSVRSWRIIRLQTVHAGTCYIRRHVQLILLHGCMPAATLHQIIASYGKMLIIKRTGLRR